MLNTENKVARDWEAMEVIELKGTDKGHITHAVQEVDSESASQIAPVEPFDRGVGTLRWILTCIGLYVGALLYGLDTTIAANVQGPILESLGEIEKLAWVGVGFPMGSVAVILLMGALLHRFEVKKLMILSIAVFEIGSAICGAAPTMNIMTLGRVVAGAGGGGMYLGALTYLTHFTSVKERPLYNGLLGICWGTGCIIGPVIGGGFAVTSATWRWAFYINLPLAGIMSPIYVFVNPPYQPQPDLSMTAKLREIDWLGAILNAGTFILLPTAITFGGSSYVWSSATNIALWSLAGAFIVAYAVQSVYCIGTTSKNRLFPVHLLKSRTMLLLFFATAATSTALSIGVYYIPIFFQFTKGDDAIHAAVRLLPFICITILFILLTGGLLPVTGLYTPFYIASGVFMIIGGALMYTVNSSTSASAIYGYSVLMGVGVGLGMQTAYSVVVVKFPLDIQNAIGLINVSQIGSVALCLSIASSIYQNVGYAELATSLAAYHVPPAILRDALGGAASSVAAQAPPAAIKLALESIVYTISLEYLLVVAAGVVCMLSGMVMRWERLKLH